MIGYNICILLYGSSLRVWDGKNIIILQFDVITALLTNMPVIKNTALLQKSKKLQIRKEEGRITLQEERGGER